MSRSGSESDASSFVPDGPWEDVTCFEDLVELNVQFLQGLLDSTPLHAAPPNEETGLIVDDLRALCAAGGGVFTFGSQPARNGPCLRQRGYVQGVWRGDVDALEAAIEAQGGLEYALFAHRGRTMRWRFRTQGQPVWSWTQKRQRPRRGPWIHQTGLWIDGTLATCCLSELGLFDTVYYSLREDPVAVVFVVVDRVWGREAGACVRAVRAAIEEAAAV